MLCHGSPQDLRVSDRDFYECVLHLLNNDKEGENDEAVDDLDQDHDYTTPENPYNESELVTVL